MQSRIVLLLFAVAAINLAHAQNASPYWSLSGNSNASTSSKLGTTNNTPLRLLTNNVERLRIATDGKVGIGTAGTLGKLTVLSNGSTPASQWGGTNALFTGFGEHASGSADFVLNMASNTGGLRPVYIGKRSRGTLAAPLAVANGDQVFAFLGSAYDGRVFQNSAAIDFRVDGTPASGSVPVGVSFFTGVNGGTRQERLRIGSNGGFAFNNNQMLLSREGAVQTTSINNGQLVATKDTLEEYSSIDINTRLFNITATGSSNAQATFTVNSESIDGALIKSEATGLRVESGFDGIRVNSEGDGLNVLSTKNKGAVINSQEDYGMSVTGQGVGVYVQAEDFSNARSIGVLTFGQATGLTGTATGINGDDGDERGSSGVRGNNRSTGAGVRGISPRGIGVSGTSTDYHGVYGTTQSTTNFAGYFDGRVFSSGGFVSASDARLKQGIKELPKGLSIIGKLQPKSYFFRRDEAAKNLNLPQGEHYGLLAQDLEKVLPNLVHDVEFNPNNSIAPPGVDTDGKEVSRAVSAGKPAQYKAINYNELIPIMIKGMQEQQAQIEAQQQTISAQHEANDQLLKRVEKLEQMLNQLSRGSQQMSLQNAYLSMATPNPASGDAVVSYQVPQGSSRAQIIITDMKGVVLRRINVAQGGGQVHINTAALSAGTYNYSLIVDGAKLDSKQLMVAR